MNKEVQLENSHFLHGADNTILIQNNAKVQVQDSTFHLKLEFDSSGISEANIYEADVVCNDVEKQEVRLLSIDLGSEKGRLENCQYVLNLSTKDKILTNDYSTEKRSLSLYGLGSYSIIWNKPLKVGPLRMEYNNCSTPQSLDHQMVILNLVHATF